MSEKKLDFKQNNPVGVVIAAFGVSRGIFWAVLFGKTMIFDWFSYSERKCSGLCIKLTAGCLKLQSTCPEKFLTWEKWKNEDFSVILYSELEKWTLAKQFGMGCQSCIRRVQRNLLSIFHWKNDDFRKIFSLWAKKFPTLPKIYGRVSETSIYVSGEKIWEKKNEK